MLWFLYCDVDESFKDMVKYEAHLSMYFMNVCLGTLEMITQVFMSCMLWRSGGCLATRFIALNVCKGCELVDLDVSGGMTMGDVTCVMGDVSGGDSIGVERGVSRGRGTRSFSHFSKVYELGFSKICDEEDCK
nr:hypothetical protein [Tanacetum cinerariifolium]